MRLLLFRSLWTNGYDVEAALADCQRRDFDGVEGPIDEVGASVLRGSGFPVIGEITTGGSYVPNTRAIEDHLEDFELKAGIAREASPLFLTVLGGCDAWPAALSVEFFGRCLQLAGEIGVAVSFETHRSRSTFHPWATAELLRQLPEMRLTCDFSHWCCVCERLVMNDEPELLAEIARRTQHIHARIGYDQGPQVPHPAAPEYAEALAAHERWWNVIWRTQAEAGREWTSMTPEFGPDGYLHTLPFSATPVASLDEVNRWMADRQRQRFAEAPLFAQ